MRSIDPFVPNKDEKVIGSLHFENQTILVVETERPFHSNSSINPTNDDFSCSGFIGSAAPSSVRFVIKLYGEKRLPERRILFVPPYAKDSFLEFSQFVPYEQ